jgi:hypothetical protein
MVWPHQMLDELRDMMVERLLMYEKKNKVLPQRILVFRDGVSEVGPFDHFRVRTLIEFAGYSGPI